MRDIVALLYTIALMITGAVLIGSSESELVQEIGRGVLVGPLTFGAFLLMMFFYTDNGKEGFPLRFLHIAWIVSIGGPVVILGSNLSLETSQFAQATAMFLSTWLTYWGCRYIVYGTLKRSVNNGSEDEWIGI